MSMLFLFRILFIGYEFGTELTSNYESLLNDSWLFLIVVLLGISLISIVFYTCCRAPSSCSYISISGSLLLDIMLCFTSAVYLKCKGCQARDSWIFRIFNRAASANWELCLPKFKEVLLKFMVFICSRSFFCSVGDSFLILLT